MASPYSSVSFPDSTRLSTTAYTPEQLQQILQPLTYQMLGINPPTFPDGRVRLDWQQTGQPAFSIDADVCSIRAVEEEQEYSQIRERSGITLNAKWRFAWTAQNRARSNSVLLQDAF